MWRRGSSCSSVGGEVSSNTTGPRFESRHRQNFYIQFTVLKHKKKISLKKFYVIGPTGWLAKSPLIHQHWKIKGRLNSIICWNSFFVSRWARDILKTKSDDNYGWKWRLVFSQSEKSNSSKKGSFPPNKLMEIKWFLFSLLPRAMVVVERSAGSPSSPTIRVWVNNFYEVKVCLKTTKINAKKGRE